MSLYFSFSAWSSPSTGKPAITTFTCAGILVMAGAAISAALSRSAWWETRTLSNRLFFLIDGEPMRAVSAAPFSFKFHTDNFGFGTHRLSAQVNLADGTLQTTPAIQYRFIGPGEEREQILTVLGGIMAAIAIALVVVAAVQDLFIRKGRPKHVHQPGEPRQYGILGGTICPRCGRPFSRHIWAVNFMVGKFDRCENYGKWVMTVRATSEALRAAEEAEMNMVKSDHVFHSPDDEPSDLIENTKFFDEI